MPFRPNNAVPPAQGLKESLVDSKVNKDNNALYQTILGIINIADALQKAAVNFFDKTRDKLPATQISGNIPYQIGGTVTKIYLPELFNVTNVESSSHYYTTWWRSGNLIFVSGKVTLETTAGAIGTEVLTELEMLLPIASNFAHEEQLTGTFVGNPFSGATVPLVGICKANPSNGRAVLQAYSPSAMVNHDTRFQFSYEFIPYPP